MGEGARWRPAARAIGARSRLRCMYVHCAHTHQDLLLTHAVCVCVSAVCVCVCPRQSLRGGAGEECREFVKCVCECAAP